MSLNRSRGLPRKKQPERASHNRQEFPTLRSLIVPVGSRVVDLINPSRAMVYSAGIVGSVHSKGRYVNNTVDGTSEIQAAGACQYQTFSRIAIIRRNFNTGLTGTISDSAVSTGDGGAQWATSAGAVSEILLNAANTVQVGISSGASMATGTEYVVGVTYDGSTVRFFIDGRAVGSTFKVQTFTIESSASLFSRGGAAGENEQFNGAIGLHADFEGALPSEVMLSLTANPWQLRYSADIDRPYSTASGGTILITASDTFTFSLTESQTSFLASIGADALTPSVSELINLLSYSVTADTLTPTLTESQAVTAGLVAMDTLTPSVTELADVIAALLVSEVLTPSLTESQSSLLFSSLSETLTPSLTESQNSFLASNLTDTLTPSLAETSVVAVLLSVLDTLTPSVTELSEIVAAISAVDSLTPSLTESQNSLLFSVVSEIFAPSLTESQNSLLSSSLVDTLSLSITDSASAVAGSSLSQTDIDAIANAVWSKVIESGMSSADILRIVLSAVSGKTAGVGTNTEKYKSVDELKDRISVSFDTDNNRTSVTRDGT